MIFLALLTALASICVDHLLLKNALNQQTYVRAAMVAAIPLVYGLLPLHLGFLDSNSWIVFPAVGGLLTLLMTKSPREAVHE